MNMTLQTRRRAWFAGRWLVVILTASLAVGQTVVDGPSMSVYIEDSPAAQELVDQARVLQSQGRLAQAVIKHQQVIDQYGSRLMDVDQGLYIDASRRVAMEIRADSDLLAAYRRLQQPLAARALDAAMGPPMDEAKLSEIVLRFGLTEAGLEAGLYLAAMQMERAAIEDAMVVLDGLSDHPDIASRGETYHLLQAAAGWYAWQNDRLEQHRAELERLGARDALDQLTAWTALSRDVVDEVTIDVLRPLPTAQWPGVTDQPLWEMFTTGQIEIFAGNVAVSHRRLQLMRNGVSQSLDYLMMPLVAGETLLLNDNDTVMALDRISGRPLWIHRPDEDSVSYQVNSGRFQFPQLMPDSRGVSVDGDTVAAIIGQASPMQRAMPGNQLETWLVCLERDDGTLRWRIKPGDIEANLEHSFFHGTPLAHSGRVFVLVRRHQMSGFNGAFVIAIDAANGAVLWRRHLSSAVPGRNRTIAAMTQMLYHAGRLYLSDNLGSVACIDARTGAAMWVAVAEDLPAPSQPVLQMRRPRVLNPEVGNPPVICEAGLVVVGVAGASDVWLLDPASGELLRQLDDDAWTDAQFVLPAMTQAGRAGAIVTVGKDVRLHDGETLEPIWTAPLHRDNQRQPQGRPVVTQSHVIVSLGDQLLVFDITSGERVETDQARTAGNIMALDDQLIVAGPTSAAGYMTWTHASEQLERRIASRPADPNPGLALAHVALVNEQWDALLQGIDAALIALDRRAAAGLAPHDDPMARQVFDEIRAMLDPEGAANAPVIMQLASQIGAMDNALRAKLFDRMARSAIGPQDLVAYHLAYGRFLTESGKHVEAVDAYQAILLDATLAGQDVQFRSGSRQAGLEATLRLGDVVRDYGVAAYAGYESMAADRLARMLAEGGAPSEAMIALAQQFPLSSSAPAARLAAADLLAQQGRRTEAIIQLIRAYNRVRDDALLPRIVGRLAELFERQDQPGRARNWLERAKREHPLIQPVREGRPMHTDVWIAQLADRSRRDEQLPVIALPLAEPRTFEGRLLTPTAQPAAQWPRDMFIVLRAPDDSVRIELRAGDDFDVAWSLPTEADDVALLSLTREQALLWSESTASLIAVDVPTGDVAWRVDGLNRQIDAIGGEAITPDQRRFRQDMNVGGIRVARRGGFELDVPVIEPGYLIAAGDMVVAVSDRAGRIVAVDRHGGNILWRHRCEMETASLMVMSDDALAIAGETRLPDEATSGILIVLDPFTKQKRMPVMPEGSAIVWMQFPEAGILRYATEQFVVGVDLNRIDDTWRLQLDAGMLTGRIVSDGSHLLAQKSDGALLIIDTDRRQVVRSISITPPSMAAPTEPQVQFGELMPTAGISDELMRVDAAPGQWLLLSPWQVQARRTDGELAWRDAISGEDRNMLMQLVGDQHVAVVADVRQGAPVAGARAAMTYYLYLFDRHGGAIRAEVPLPIEMRPLPSRQAMLLDGGIVVDGGDRTVLVTEQKQAP
jgi:outer membrane protein assembly factor BamB/tetratricopeptide (TPR) repeat protein